MSWGGAYCCWQPAMFDSPYAVRHYFNVTFCHRGNRTPVFLQLWLAAAGVGSAVPQVAPPLIPLLTKWDHGTLCEPWCCWWQTLFLPAKLGIFRVTTLDVAWGVLKTFIVNSVVHRCSVDFIWLAVASLQNGAWQLSVQYQEEPCWCVLGQGCLTYIAQVKYPAL